jgi:hypothetical protein
MRAMRWSRWDAASSIWLHVPLCMTCCLLSNGVLFSFQHAAQRLGSQPQQGPATRSSIAGDWAITGAARPCRRRRSHSVEDGLHCICTVQHVCQTPGEDPRPIRHLSRAIVGDQSGVNSAPATKINRWPSDHPPVDVDHLGHSILVVYCMCIKYLRAASSAPIRNQREYFSARAIPRPLVDLNRSKRPCRRYAGQGEPEQSDVERREARREAHCIASLLRTRSRSLA